MKIFRLLAMTGLLLVSLPALAAAPLSGKSSGDEPVEINADNLEVVQEKNIAIFTGNVVAVQGTMRLKSDRMTVHYRSGDQKTEGQDAISKIEVDGNVFLSTPEETASGDKGIYEPDKKEVHLVSNVVLTKGQNVLKGNTLVYNMVTGKSVVNAPVGNAQTKSSGRVRALFVPDKKAAPAAGAEAPKGNQ